MARSRSSQPEPTGGGSSRRGGAGGSRYELPEPELIVVAHPDAGLRATATGLMAASVDTAPLARSLGGASLKPLFEVTEDRLRYEASAAAASGVDVPDLSVYYRVHDHGADPHALAEELASHDAISGAYVKPPAEPPDLNDMAPAPGDAPPATADFTSRQGYLDAAPGGIDARAAWTVAGGGGAGVRIVDVEGAWRFTHEDLLQNQGGVIGGTMSADIAWRNHGTAVAGEFGGDRNPFGITGIAPDANVRAVSIFGGTGSANAIRTAANALSAGDIILIELHRPGPRNGFANRNDQLGYIAVEWWDDDFAAIAYAVGRGVIVVEAAGNGAENLDDALYNTPGPGFPASWRNPFNRANRDSGAIIVGAGAPPPGTHGRNWGPDRSRLDFSNFGSCVDAQGWGREVTTTGYGDLQGGASEDLWYTDQFSGTSSASPIVVGAVAATQGAMRAKGTPKTPAQMRQLLRTTGSPQQDAPGRPATQRIGNRPDLRALIGIRKTLLKERIKEATKEKLEAKELKDRIKDKSEVKDQKDIRKEKLESKELKDARKELKLEVDGKVILKEKITVESQKLQAEIDPADLLQAGRLRGVGGLGAPEDGGDAGGGTLEERLGRLEQAVGELAHFIGPELRPDLGAGALSGEDDVQALSAELEKNAADAKQAKDVKDVEKAAER